MKRQLTKEEATICNKSMEARKKEIADLSKLLKYHKAGYELYQAKIKHEDAVQSYLREEQEKTYSDNFKAIEEKLTQSTLVIAELKRQIKEGVEVKENKQVG